MRARTFLILLVAAGVLVGLALLRHGGEKTDGEMKMGDKLFADLPVNRVASVAIADAEHRVTLVSDDTGWQVKDRDGYPADFNQLRDTVVKLSRLKTGRSFAGTPESLSRLKLLDPSAGDAAGRGQSITLKAADGTILADVILGQNRATDDGGSGGQYLKRAGSDTVYLVDGSFRFMKTAPADWLRKEVLSIKGEAIAGVTCYTGGSSAPVYALVRPDKGKPATLTAVPEGRTADTAKIDQLLDALDPLNLDDVSRSDSPPAADDTRLVYRLFDGRQITIYPRFDGNDRYTLRISADVSPPAEDAAEPTAAQPAGEAKPADSAAAAPSGDAPPVRTAQEINDTLGPWIFSVKKWQYDSFITDVEKLLDSVKTKTE